MRNDEVPRSIGYSMRPSLPDRAFTLMLAPLEGWTDPAYRMLCYQYGADLTFTEMARVESLARRNRSTLQRIRMPDGSPTVIQLLGKKEEDLKRFLQTFTPDEGFMGFNLNLGCPSPDMVAIGHGCAMIKRISKVRSLISLIKAKGYPCSIKARLGMNSYEKERKAYLNLINETDADFYIMHARHGKESYGDPADFSVYPALVATNRRIIANGDITSMAQVEALRRIGIAGVMIGRAAMENPAIFAKLKGNHVPPKEKLIEEYMDLARRFSTPAAYIKRVINQLS